MPGTLGSFLTADKSMNQHDSEAHLSVNTLWMFSRRRLKLHDGDFQHIVRCDHCISILGLCETCDSLSKVMRRLSEQAELPRVDNDHPIRKLQ
jgi:hypothetical protein